MEVAGRTPLRGQQRRWRAQLRRSGGHPERSAADLRRVRRPARIVSTWFSIRRCAPESRYIMRWWTGRPRPATTSRRGAACWASSRGETHKGDDAIDDGAKTFKPRLSNPALAATSAVGDARQQDRGLPPSAKTTDRNPLFSTPPSGGLLPLTACVTPLSKSNIGSIRPVSVPLLQFLLSGHGTPHRRRTESMVGWCWTGNPCGTAPMPRTTVRFAGESTSQRSACRLRKMSAVSRR